MVCEFFESYNPQERRAELLKTIQEIIQYYTEHDYVLTCRQVFYQLVTKNLVENTEEEYKLVTNLITAARMAGLIDWDVIVDRNRSSDLHYSVFGIDDAIEDTLKTYRLNKMFYQEKVYVEVMIEKMAIYEIVHQITDNYSIRLTGDKGNCSKTILYDLSKRIQRYTEYGRECHILYIGDHDPSGLMMDESIQNTLALMNADITFHRVALTYDQAIGYNLPLNNVKKSDTNAKKYIKKYGEYSWECDAIQAPILQKLLDDKIRKIIDMNKFKEIIKREEEDKKKLKQTIKYLQNKEKLRQMMKQRRY